MPIRTINNVVKYVPTEAHEPRAVAKLSVVGGQIGGNRKYFLNFEKKFAKTIRKFLINSQ